MPLALVMAAVLLPPLALFLDEGISREFWSAFGLTCLGFLPGVVYALLVLARKRRRTAQAA